MLDKNSERYENPGSIDLLDEWCRLHLYVNAVVEGNSEMVPISLVDAAKLLLCPKDEVQLKFTIGETQYDVVVPDELFVDHDNIAQKVFVTEKYLEAMLGDGDDGAKIWSISSVTVHEEEKAHKRLTEEEKEKKRKRDGGDGDEEDGDREGKKAKKDPESEARNKAAKLFPRAFKKEKRIANSNLIGSHDDGLGELFGCFFMAGIHRKLEKAKKGTELTDVPEPPHPFPRGDWVMEKVEKCLQQEADKLVKAIWQPKACLEYLIGDEEEAENDEKAEQIYKSFTTLLSEDRESSNSAETARAGPRIPPTGQPKPKPKKKQKKKPPKDREQYCSEDFNGDGKDSEEIDDSDVDNSSGDDDDGKKPKARGLKGKAKADSEKHQKNKGDDDSTDDDVPLDKLLDKTTEKNIEGCGLDGSLLDKTPEKNIEGCGLDGSYAMSLLKETQILDTPRSPPRKRDVAGSTTSNDDELSFNSTTGGVPDPKRQKGSQAKILPEKAPRAKAGPKTTGENPESDSEEYKNTKNTEEAANPPSEAFQNLVLDGATREEQANPPEQLETQSQGAAEADSNKNRMGPDIAQGDSNSKSLPEKPSVVQGEVETQDPGTKEPGKIVGEDEKNQDRVESEPPKGDDEKVAEKPVVEEPKASTDSPSGNTRLRDVARRPAKATWNIKPDKGTRKSSRRK
jgi:hypothetical protein